MEKETIDQLDRMLKFGPLLVTVVVGIWVWYKFNKQHVLNTELQDHKAELDKNIKQYEQRLQELTESQKYQNQRRLTDFSLYAAKKHERYIDLYEKLCNALNIVIWRNSPLRSLPFFTDYNHDDMIEFLDKYNITRARKEELLVLWESDSRGGVRQIYDMMTAQEDIDTSKAVHDAVRAYIQADLYLPRNLSNEIDKYTTKLNDLTFLCNRETRREGLLGEEHQKMYEQREELKAYIENEFPCILRSMQKTLLDDSES